MVLLFVQAMATISASKQKQIALFQIVGIFVVPILLIYFDIISKGLRIYMLVSMSVIIYLIMRKEKWTLHSIGLSTHTFKKYLIPYLVFMSIGVISIVMYADNFEMEPQNQWWTKTHFLVLFIIISALQEFAYRAFLIPKLKVLCTDRLGIVIINALLFTLLHIIFPIPQIMLPLAFIGGLAFSVMYMKYPNLVLVSIAHSVLNFVAVLHGFFVIHS